MINVIKDMECVNGKIDEMLDNLGNDDFNDGIPFVIEYNGEKVEIPFCPGSVEHMQMMLSDLIQTFREDYL